MKLSTANLTSRRSDAHCQYSFLPSKPYCGSFKAHADEHQAEANMNVRTAILSSAAAATVALLAFGANAAGLDGTTVGLQAYYPDTSTLYSDAGTAVVGPGVEFGPTALTGYPLSFDLSADQIDITSTVDSTFEVSDFNGFKFSFSTAIPISATIDSSSGFDPVSVTLSDGALFLNYEGVPVSNGESSIIDLTFSSSAPEPSTWALMIAGVGVIGASLRFRRGREDAAFAPV